MNVGLTQHTPLDTVQGQVVLIRSSLVQEKPEIQTDCEITSYLSVVIGIFKKDSKDKTSVGRPPPKKNTTLYKCPKPGDVLAFGVKWA